MKHNYKALKLILNILGMVLFGASLQGQTLDPNLARLDSSGEITWYDAEFLALKGQGWTDTRTHYDRLPAHAKGVVSEAVWNLGQHTAGMSIPFQTDAESIEVKWTLLSSALDMPHMPATGVSGVDLYMKNADGTWRFVKNGRPRSQSNTVKFDVSADTELRLYLPLYNGITSMEIGIPVTKSLSSVPVLNERRWLRLSKPNPDPKPIVFYGTSITQGGCVSRPGLSVTAIVARALDVPVINLGFSGAGNMEPEMAELISELDASIYVLDCLWNMDNEMVSNRIKPFVRILREHHPKTPILLVEDSSFEDISPTSNGVILKRLYQELQAEGFKNIAFLSNKGMLGTDFEGTVDGVHHNDLGMMRQADVFKVKLASMLE